MQNPKIISQLKKDCCGCAACLSICPCNAILMEKDIEGFLYPHIDETKCIKCGRCDMVCAFKQKDSNKRESTIMEQYAIKYKDDAVRLNSQAGGSFAALATYLLEKYENVSIYGASYYDVYKVKHISIHSKDEIDKLQGSKYIQSNMIGIYNSIERELNNNIIVMFAGTPCQNHAIKTYMIAKGISTTNLYLMDFICEGVASPLVWEEYIKAVEKKYKGKVESVIFRDKRLGWIEHYETISIANRKRKIAGRRWTNCFYDNLFFRESCHNCKYTSMNRESDITVSWFGSVDRKIPSFDDGIGVSGIMINTEKGKEWFTGISSSVDYIPVTMEDLMQKQLKHPIEKSELRAQFWKEFLDGNKLEVLKKYDSGNTLKHRVKIAIKNIIQSEWKWI